MGRTRVFQSADGTLYSHSDNGRMLKSKGLQYGLCRVHSWA